ncbi:MAG: phosphoribosyltransferase family protein [Gemmatimonadales bacterium]
MNLPPTRTEVPTMPRQRPAPTRDILDADWAFFGELCRALALKVARSYDPEIVIGVAKAGVIPAAIIASILQREFAAMVISRQSDDAAPELRIGPPPSVRGRRVLVVDETCDTGDTMKLALNEVRKLHPAEVRTAVSFTTGAWRADFHAFETDKAIILPWDREVIEDGELVTRPDLRAWLQRHDQPGSTSAG